MPNENKNPARSPACLAALAIAVAILAALSWALFAPMSSCIPGTSYEGHNCDREEISLVSYWRKYH